MAAPKFKFFSPETNAYVRNRLAEDGIEMTPAELAQTARAALANVRANLLAVGFRVPDDDEELMTLLAAARAGDKLPEPEKQ